jgi:hypothetical protein
MTNKAWYDDETKDVIYKNLVELAEMSIQKESMFNDNTVKKIIKKLISIRLIDKKHFAFLFDSKIR